MKDSEFKNEYEKLNYFAGFCDIITLKCNILHYFENN